MDTQHLDGGFADPAREGAQAFRAALTVLSRPGRIESLHGAAPPAPCSPAAGALLLTLCDTTTGLFLAPSHDTDAVRGWITFHVGSPFVGPERAMFALGTWEALGPVSRYAIGTPEYPDRGATLIAEVERLEPEGALLTGPGIKDSARLSLPEIAAFQANRRHFPLGFDCYFTCGDRLAGLPRSTRVEEG